MSATTIGYYTDRQEQDARYERVTGLDPTETWRQEYRDYFGVGDHAGEPQETRVTFKTHLQDNAQESEPTGCVTPDEAFQLSGAQLAILATAGDYVAAGEIVRRRFKRAMKRMAA